ncbi:MAG: hypothetical protein OIF48_04675 [Silicimonas sp.]|nr:hypothetical protein [Silicimonas sp.]
MIGLLFLLFFATGLALAALIVAAGGLYPVMVALVLVGVVLIGLFSRRAPA